MNLTKLLIVCRDQTQGGFYLQLFKIPPPMAKLVYTEFDIPYLRGFYYITVGEWEAGTVQQSKQWFMFTELNTRLFNCPESTAATDDMQTKIYKFINGEL